MEPMHIPEELRDQTDIRRPAGRETGRKAMALVLIALLVIGGFGASIAAVV